MENQITITDIPRIECTEDEFSSLIYPKREPVVITGLDIGRCTETWTANYLIDRVHPCSVQAHVSTQDKLDFLSKNFSYKNLSFSEFVRRCDRQAESQGLSEYFFDKNEFYYLRCVGNDPRKEVADFVRQFPEISSDLILPRLYPDEDFFSSVLRLASPGTGLWTHYDIMDNILIHVRGHKKVVLFHPNQLEYLYLKGDKSEVCDITTPDQDRFPLFRKATQYQTQLQPGDVLFIPALWLHNIKSLDFTVSVNVFWRHLSPDLYQGKDVYGNKDLSPASAALEGFRKSLTLLAKLPPEYRDFYLRRMRGEIAARLVVDEN